ncbi:hypothetical protein EVAR_83253_1 [Eumeta japonica]|uniref:Uncharacterized protein n=1 Tax=Eumeta variegata TaxID=151549 RepID=A0A4C1Y683_EUMVA|nr:hypothetical protein EVAR_83253_1 [Eumeta japonica]
MSRLLITIPRIVWLLIVGVYFYPPLPEPLTLARQWPSGGEDENQLIQSRLTIAQGRTSWKPKEEAHVQ